MNRQREGDRNEAKLQCWFTMLGSVCNLQIIVHSLLCPDQLAAAQAMRDCPSRFQHSPSLDDGPRLGVPVPNLLVVARGHKAAAVVGEPNVLDALHRLGGCRSGLSRGQVGCALQPLPAKRQQLGLPPHKSDT